MARIHESHHFLPDRYGIVKICSNCSACACHESEKMAELCLSPALPGL